MELNELLDALDRAAANLRKLEGVWARAEVMLTAQPALGSSMEYEDLQRTWVDLLPGLPPIDGWTITGRLPDLDEVQQRLIAYREVGKFPTDVVEETQRPGRDVAEYRHRLHRARRRAIRQRLEELSGQVEAALPRITDGVPRISETTLAGSDVDLVSHAIDEIERLMGDTTERHGRWSDLHRHLHFGQGHDWHDIFEFDWPSVREDVRAAGFSETDPLPVPDIDLGAIAGGNPTGAATTALAWERLDDDGFERLLLDIFIHLPGYQNAQWLTKTRAPDRGRDLLVERVLQSGDGDVRTERVLVQAKHWQSRSVNHEEVARTVSDVKLWEPPSVHAVIVATSGRFTTDAVAWTKRHNVEGSRPRIDLWADNRLETLISRFPYLAVSHGLR